MKNEVVVKIQEAIDMAKEQPGSALNTLVIRSLETAALRKQQETEEQELFAISTPLSNKIQEAIDMAKEQPGSALNTLVIRALEEAALRHYQSEAEK